MDKVVKELNAVLKGEDKGIGMVEEIIKGDLDTTSHSLIDGIMTVDHQHLREMAKMISDHELMQ